MPCEHYKNALIEAAASGSQPQGDLRGHLALCDACRAAFEQEQSLFASVDTGLNVTANAEVPASLLPRVRARLDEAAAPRSGWVTNWFALASAAVMVVAFFAARAVWRTNVVQKPVETAGNTNVPPRVTPPPQKQTPVVVPTVEKNSVSQRQLVIAKNALAPEALVRGKTMPEVLVPRDQEVLLAEYTEQWRFRKRAPLLAQDSDATMLALLQVAPIQIAELDVKLLAEERSQ
jgi:hypothetical protein